jgi:hypothetical protein
VEKPVTLTHICGEKFLEKTMMPSTNVFLKLSKSTTIEVLSGFKSYDVTKFEIVYTFGEVYGNVVFQSSSTVKATYTSIQSD